MRESCQLREEDRTKLLTDPVLTAVRKVNVAPFVGEKPLVMVTLSVPPSVATPPPRLLRP